ncbi:MAG: DUF3341 domain-containing protein [Planctomycetota bacterium]|jgi:hypothetical protein
MLNKLLVKLGLIPGKQHDLFLGMFTDEFETLEAVTEITKEGFEYYDVFAPFAVHGLDRAMDLPRSKITYVTFFMGLFGLTFGLVGLTYVTSIDWPINIGGKQGFPFASFVPVLFELTVLIAGLSTMVGLFIFCKIFPGKRPRLFHPRVTDDTFVIALNKVSGFDEKRARAIFEKYNATEIKSVDPDYDAYEETLGGAA